MIQPSKTAIERERCTSLSTLTESRPIKGRRRRWGSKKIGVRAAGPVTSGPRKLALLGSVPMSKQRDDEVSPFKSLSAALRAKDPYTWNHSLRVGAFAGGIARVLGMAEDQISLIRCAGELHDIGKIGVPLELLRKAGQLTCNEYLRVMEHPIIGEGMVAQLVPQGSPITAAVRWHHTRYDGCGAPHHMRGAQIPLAARIVAVADAFDAMTSTRPYRIALSLDTALAELTDHAGSQFDPECVRALRDLYRTRSAVELRGVAVPA